MVGQAVLIVQEGNLPALIRWYHHLLAYSVMYDFKKKQSKAYDQQALIDKLNTGEYHLLTVDDELDYSAVRDREQHYYSCRRIAKGLAALLYLKSQLFFQHLQVQENLEDADSKEKDAFNQNNVPKFRLRACLQSCLEIFSRQSYLIFTQLSQNSLQKQRSPASYWQLFKVITLMVLKRISLGCTSQQKIILMNGWYLDTCKLLDICLIYGQKYRTAVVDLLRNVFTKGEELQDFQKDFRRVLELIYLKLKELCEEYQGFAGIDFARLQESSQLYQNFHNAESTLTKSLLKTLFSTYDLIKNLQAIVQYFPSRCKVQLLEHILVYKRFIMIYSKLRYYDESQWRFGARQNLFRPFINQLKASMASFIGNAMAKTSKLIKELPQQSPHRMDLKRTFANFWHFTLNVPAVSYQHRDNQTRLAKAAQHGRQLGIMIIRQRGKELFLSQTIEQFNKKAVSFTAITNAMEINKEICDIQKKKSDLERMQAWKLPSFLTFLKDTGEIPQKPPNFIVPQQSSMKQYNDQPTTEDDDLQQQNYPTLDSYQMSYYSQSYFQKDEQTEQITQDKTERTAIAIQKRKDETQGLFDELQLSSIGCNNSQHYCSQVMSDSIAQDSLESVEDMLSLS